MILFLDRTLTMILTINSALNLIITSQIQYMAESQVFKGIKRYISYVHICTHNNKYNDVLWVCV